ncbi:PH domain-containing protein [Salegentibacter sp. F188]|uniref:PH domain-containing protein n=1 Tax=Autumnicola patrickiae TaxID=3075591 RepID=A0ABU3E191_9FLAO|nr:PH domain-containing protein [Salegentibacter sp. F188]MDT0689771.1 PH domain-containing protein [Salegentibacter sp. F188]
MASVEAESSFENKPIAIDTLPRYQEVGLNGISKKLLIKNLIQISVWFLAFLLLCGYMFFYTEERFLITIVAAAGFLLFSFLYFNAWKIQKIYGYAIRERDIIYRKGFLITNTTVISFNRIQHVSISRGVLDKMLGISTLSIFTAGGSGSDISIPGLEPELAQTLKEALVIKISEDGDATIQ